MEIMHVWIAGVAGLGGMAPWSGYQYRPLQALGAWPGRVEMVQACAGLRVWPGRDGECLWIPGLAGFEGWFGRDCGGLRVGRLG
jgi:hypothetical protein